ncbi:MAG: hypothetical protein EAZ97_16010 [Bacteroidetes bacterium]|nr:MAG: hypothetical protein EAZ97_16010 [Bacteroidota bacterium]
MNISENDFPEKYREIIRRLQKAQSEQALRNQMTLEDDLRSQIENIWRESAENKEKIAKQEKVIEEKEKTIEEKEKTIEEKEKTIEEKEKALQNSEQTIRKLLEEIEKMKNK